MKIPTVQPNKWYPVTGRGEMFVTSVDDEYAYVPDYVYDRWVPCDTEPFVKANGERRMMQLCKPVLLRIPLADILV